jgi:hypothetical protein
VAPSEGRRGVADKAGGMSCAAGSHVGVVAVGAAAKARAARLRRLKNTLCGCAKARFGAVPVLPPVPAGHRLIGDGNAP